ncbi:hypothetical protein N7492_004435 [Penicillium capsulatum]|uniref:Transcription factor hoxa13 n=1 Tax=Penicillium capsulatum TaxID=69766 RepID=A0A9W9IDW1_9EURO|nr:hypothetical protein N7492_004435 [Penicillium capsulatum]KAJ6136445.1 hypothetical protein N7512_001605 [Penicillium capsulatum]
MAVVKQNGPASDVSTSQNGQKDVGKPERKRSSLRWTVGLIVRLCIWYTLLTPFLRCPSNPEELTETSPRVCKPYLIGRSYVEPYITPYVTPYYETYAAPYVDQARPYIEVFHAQVYTPTYTIVQSGYEKYGAPAWQQAQVYGAEQWKIQVTPRVQAAQDKLHQLYLAELDPYVQRGKAVVSPYFQKANTVMFTVYWDHLVPFYTRSQPFIGKTYSTGQQVLVTHVVPGVRYTWSSVVYFANSSLWPHVTGLYSEQVEPQLVKISQRLASYREGKRIRSAVEDTDSPSSDEPQPSTSSSSQKLTHTSTSSSTTTTTETPTFQPALSAAEKEQKAREQVASDLQRWQDKFSVAADKGVEDLEERIEEIVAALVASSANAHGQSLATALQAVAAKQVSGIKDRINDLVQTLPEEDAPEAEESTRDQLVSDIRTSAISVRDRAHTLREWSLTFEEELLRRVSAAVNSTLDVLDSIRDLGLQEIGMRWAWMDTVTYKDWARYHALKAQLDDWRDEIRKVGMNHKSVAEAKAVAADILASGMDVAEDTAKELIRLKDVGHWKMAAREVSDNFETRTEPPPARPKPQEEVEEAEDVNVDQDESTEADEYVETVPEDTSPEEHDTSASNSDGVETDDSLVSEASTETNTPPVDTEVVDESTTADDSETIATPVDDSSASFKATPTPAYEEL